jgi:hypothetical protein
MILARRRSSWLDTVIVEAACGPPFAQRLVRRVAACGSTFFVVLALPANAQGVPGGVAHGVHQGNRIAGPVGALWEVQLAEQIGGVEGLLGINHQYRTYYAAPRRSYRRKSARISVRYSRHTYYR